VKVLGVLAGASLLSLAVGAPVQSGSYDSRSDAGSSYDLYSDAAPTTRHLRLLHPAQRGADFPGLEVRTAFAGLSGLFPVFGGRSDGSLEVGPG
jgi:hypothetical protein